MPGGVERGLDGRRAFVVRVVQDGLHHEAEVLGIDEYRFAEVETEHKDHHPRFALVPGKRGSAAAVTGRAGRPGCRGCPVPARVRVGGLYGAPVSIEMPSAGADARPEAELPVVDEALAAALTAQGEAGVRALGLLRDARRALAGAGFVRPAEVAAACVRSAADALLGLPGAPRAVGLQSAAQDLLAAVDAVRPPAAAAVARAGAPADDTDSGALQGASVAVGAAWERVVAAAEVLRGELERPGGFHRARARGIVERLTGVTLGAVQETALEVWGTIYGAASGILHGRAAGPDEAVVLYTDVLAAARELLVPLPDRAARVLQLAALTQPGAAEAAELARWADPRAEAYFFRSGPAAAWLEVLQEHASHLLLADEAAGGHWSAAPFLEHLAATVPDAARQWLAGHAVQLAAAGPGALDALLRLALAGALTPAGVRLLIPYVLVPARPGGLAEQASWSRRLAARWARTLPVAGRDGDWLFVAEALLQDAVDVEHAGFLAMQAVLKRAHAAEERAPAGTARQEARADLEANEALQQEWAAGLPVHDVVDLLRELVATVHGAGDGPFRWARAVRYVVAGLLRRDVEASSKAARHVVFDVDLDEVRLRDSLLVVFLGPLLARAVLDLAAADAAAGLPLTERMRAWPRIDAADTHLHDRLLAAHLAAHLPTAGTAGAGEWWERAVEVTVRLLAGRPTAEGARLVALVLRDCPPERAAGLQQRARTALGPAPAAADVEQVLPADAGQADGRIEPLASWLRVWDWSPVLPAPLLAGFAPLLAAVRRLRPAGPPDPRAVDRPVPRNHTVVALEKEDLLELAATAGPLAAAAALAGAEDAGADGYAIVLHHLVKADPVVWTVDVPRILAALARPEFGAFYLAAAAITAAEDVGAFPAGPVPAALAALTLRRTLPAPAAGQRPSTAVMFADQALFDLLTLVWRTGADLAEGLPAVLDHLRDLAEPLTRPAGPAAGGAAAGGEQDPDADLLGSHPAVRALGCLLEYAASRAGADDGMPGDVLQLVADVLAARAGDEAVATAIGVQLPVLHRRASAFAAAHPELYALDPHRPSPAAAWLRWGGLDPLLLAALDRGRLLAAVRENLPGATSHVTYALLAGHHDLLGDPAAAWRELAAGPGGAAAASRLLTWLALGTRGRPRPGDAAPDAAARAAVDAATMWWTAALEAGLPPGALAGAGDFAGSALADEVWLPLARRSAEHTPVQTEAGDVSERAAGHPRSLDALLLATHLLTRPAPDPWYDAEVRKHARALLQATTALPEAEYPAQAEQLRRALVEAGEVDLASTPTAAG